MMNVAPYQSVFDRVFDVVVLGGGYGGFAAARELHARGRSVLLVDRSAALLWESGWAFETNPGTSDDPRWQTFVKALSDRGAATPEHIDGAIAEVVATHLIKAQGPPVLYYATPVAVQRDGDGLISAVALGTKAGLRWLRARQWIDTTDQGELLRLVAPGFKCPAPASIVQRLFYRHAQWKPGALELDAPMASAGAELRWSTTLWPNERCATLKLPGQTEHPRLQWLPALRLLAATLGNELDAAVLTHASVVPIPEYTGKTDLPQLPPNVVAACACVIGSPVPGLAGRFQAGLSAAESIAGAAQARIDKLDASTPIQFAERSTEVLVAGLGTGGALAALAAARQGAKVYAVDHLPFAGGIGSGGGIHLYYHGVKGGLQEEVDDRTRQIMPLFGKTSQVSGFHPDAKKLAIEQLLVEAGVTIAFGATLFGVEKTGPMITAAHVATGDGPLRIAARVCIDSTGDGDLSAMGGARYVLGRTGDGLLHAYSQSSGRAGLNKQGDAQMHVINFDAGFVDPMDAQDLTRARLVGIEHYLQQRYTATERPTYIAPAIGLRQSRQIQTDYVLTLSDLIERREFADAVGYTGCHYDNHAVDYAMESDEAMFWVWCCQQWRGRTACQIPYRILLPAALNNVLLACRAAGVSEEAHHSFRMQRDMQRLGEVAGYAAALAVHHGCQVRSVPFDALRKRLEQTGALQLQAAGNDPFGQHADATLFTEPLKQVSDEQIDQWVAELRAGPGQAMWHLYRRPAQAQSRVIPLIDDADADISWRAATVSAMWNSPAAEPRLIRAVRTREYGFDQAPPEARPERYNRLAPRWIVAIVLLRRCGSPACLDALHATAISPGLLLNARTAIALTCQHIATRCKLTDDQKTLLSGILVALWKNEVPDAVRGMQQHVVSTTAPSQGPEPTNRLAVSDNFTWQIHLAVAKAEEAAGLKIHEEVKAFTVDPRAFVRRAFSSVTQRF